MREIAQYYKFRDASGIEKIHSPLTACNAIWRAELYVEMARLISGWLDDKKLNECAILEVGSGNGANLLDLIRLGANPELIHANDLLPERLESAKRRLPLGVKFYPGDLMSIDIAPESMDLVLQFLMLSSICDIQSRREVIERIWSWLKPGGAMLSYDFCYNNPRNPSTRKLTISELRSFFPVNTSLKFRRLTLAPPIARCIAPLSDNLFKILSLFPFLNSHAICLITKGT